MIPEFINWVSFLEKAGHDFWWAQYLKIFESVIFSLVVIGILCWFFGIAACRLKLIPGRLQGFAEIIIETIDDLICGILGKENGRKYLPFLGTIFIYIVTMNFLGLIPMMRSSTTSLSTTAAIGLSVFVYVTYTAFKKFGFLGFFDHLAGKPRGIMAMTVIMPLMMFILHFFAEIVRPITLSLRLRSNIWGDDVLLASFAGMGLQTLPLLFFNTLIAIMTALVQAIVFCLLATIYFSLVVNEDKH